MDPLRPFADAIRALWRARVEKTSRSESSASTAPHTLPQESPTRAARTEENLRTRLSVQVAQIDIEDPRKVRKAFVETVLLWELGDAVSQDAEFGEMVTQVADQLGRDAVVSERLHRLVLQLASSR